MSNGQKTNIEEKSNFEVFRNTLEQNVIIKFYLLIFIEAFYLWNCWRRFR